MDDETQSTRDADMNAPDRTAEHDDAAEPDVPTAAEQNEGLSTVLSGKPAEGVQDNASEK